MPEERRLVTLMFADIVGSTPMATEHDAELVRGALDTAFGGIAPVIARHGGTVEKFIGDAVMAVFGVPRAHDDDAERAVRAAFAVRDVVVRTAGPLALQVRIGIATGEAVTRTGGGDQRLVTGIAVNLAQRLQSLAAPGEILCGDLAHRLTENAVRFGEPRPIDAKGIGRITAWPAEALISAFPGRDRRRESMRAPLLGRDGEMAQLRDLLGRVASTGRPMLVTVFGAAGIGKTRLAEAFLAGIDPSRVIRGRSLPYGEGVAGYPVQQMLRSDAGIELTETREAAVEKLRARVSRIVGPDDDLDAIQRRTLVLAGVAAVGDALPDVAPADVADEVRWAFRRYMERRAADAPAVLLFEDIHWAAPTVLELIEHLAEWARAPLLLLCLARPDLRDARPSWGAVHGSSVVVQLAPLSTDATAELLQALLGTDAPSDAVRSEVLTRSEGNPLYLEEFLRTLIETGHIVRQDGTWVTRPGVRETAPPTLQGLIAAHLDRVSADTKRVLQEAAVIGRGFSSSALGALHGEPVAGALREAVASDLIEEAEAWSRGRGALYRFRHVLVRDVAYTMLPKSDRAVLHDRYRQWFEQTTGERRDEFIEVVAEHAGQAYRSATTVRSHDLLRLARIAFDRLRIAADRSRARGDLRAALAFWGEAKSTAEALELTDEERILLEVESLLLRTWTEPSEEVWAEVEAVLQRARAVPPTEPFVRLVIADGRRMYPLSVDASAKLMREAYRAATAIGDHELIARALLELPVAAVARGDLAELGRTREEALTYARAHGVTRELSACLTALANWSLWSGAFTRAASLLDEAERRAKEMRSAAAQFAALSSWTELTIWTGPWDAAVRYAEQLGPIAADLATRKAAIDHLNLLGRSLYEAGDLAAARSAHSVAVGMCEPGSFDLVYTTFDLAFTLIAVGEVREARRMYEVVEREEIPWQNFHAVNAVVAATLHAAEGNGGAADVLYRRAIAIFEEGTITPNRLRWAQQLYAEFLIRERRRAEARALLEQVRDFFSDPLAAPRRARVEALIAETVVQR